MATGGVICCAESCTDPEDANSAVQVSSKKSLGDPTQEELVNAISPITPRSGPPLAPPPGAPPVKALAAAREDLADRFNRRWAEAADADEERLEILDSADEKAVREAAYGAKLAAQRSRAAAEDARINSPPATPGSSVYGGHGGRRPSDTSTRAAQMAAANFQSGQRPRPPPLATPNSSNSMSIEPTLVLQVPQRPASKRSSTPTIPENISTLISPSNLQTQTKTQRFLRFLLILLARLVLFTAWWFGAKRLDADGDGDIDAYDVEVFLENTGVLSRNFTRKKTPQKKPSPKAKAKAVAKAKASAKAQAKASAKMPQTNSATTQGDGGILDVLDKQFGNGNGEFDVDDLFETEVSGIVEEEEVAEMLVTGQAKPWFIATQTALALGLWFCCAVKLQVEGATDQPLWTTKAGLDTFSEYDFDLRLGFECVDVRHQVWRWWSYQFTHGGIMHVMSNCLFNIIFGIPLEGVHGSARMILMYNVGVFGGAMMFFVSSAHTVVIGMSGGCYSLLGMHVADLVMNWHNKKYRKPTVAIIVVLAASDMTQYFSTQDGDDVSHSAHAGGYFAGICIGIVIGRNLKVKQWERILSAIILFLGCACSLYSFIWLAVSWPPRAFYEAGGWCWARQVYNPDLFQGDEDDWECVRCGSNDCISHFIEERYIERVTWAFCRGRGWAFRDGLDEPPWR